MEVLDTLVVREEERRGGEYLVHFKWLALLCDAVRCDAVRCDAVRCDAARQDAAGWHRTRKGKLTTRIMLPKCMPTTMTLRGVSVSDDSW